MKRRDFIKNTAASTSLLSLGALSLSSFQLATNTTKKLTILHTNDTHSQIEPFPLNHPKTPNMGGVARRAAIVEQIRKVEDNVLLLDAGDIFQGTPYFNYYGGELEFKLMSMMKYDLATIGNHDFDNGITGLYGQLPNATFEFVSANYDFKNTVLDTLVKPYKIFNKKGIKVGIFGLGVELYGLVDPRYYKETKYLDPVEIATDITTKLKDVEKCDLVICLSHLGFEYKNEPGKISDINLARKTKNIDLIIGGHTHTFLDKPVIEKNLDGQDVIINQVGAFGVNLGRIDFLFDSKEKVSATGKKINI